MSPKIRNPTIEDLDTCFNLEKICFPSSEAAPKYRIEKRIKEYPQGFLIAEIDGDIAGMLNSGCIDKDDISDEEIKSLIGHTPDGKNAVIFSLAVLPKYQKLGIATKLLKKFIEQSKRKKKQKILLLCKKFLIPFYEKQGFSLIKKSKSNYGGFEQYEMELLI